MNISTEVVDTTLSGTLFHILIISLVKNYSVLSVLTLWPLNFSSFPLVGSSGPNVNKSTISTLLNLLTILKHSINLPLSLCFVNQLQFLKSRFVWFVYGWEISLVAFLSTFSSFWMSLFKWGSQNCTAYIKMNANHAFELR